MKNNAVKLSVATVVFVSIGFFTANPVLSSSQNPMSTLHRSKATKHCPWKVWVGDYEIQSSDDVAALSKYTKIKGNLSVRGVENLEGLEYLKRIDGDLTILWEVGIMTSLKGLDNLRSVSGDVSIETDTLLWTLGLGGLKRLSYVGGDLRIVSEEAAFGAGFSSLGGFNNLRYVAGSLVLRSSIKSFKEFGRLKKIGGGLDISFSSAPSLNGFKKLKVIGGTLSLHECYRLENFKGFKRLKSIDGSLVILDCASLTSLEGLNSLSSVTGSVLIDTNYSLENLKGLGKIKTIGGDLGIFFGGPTRLEGLGKLKSIGGNLTILYTDSLTSLEGLNSLSSVAGSVWIDSNDALESFEGLENLIFIGDILDIIYNPELCTSLAEAFRDQILDADGIGGQIDITGNKDC